MCFSNVTAYTTAAIVRKHEHIHFVIHDEDGDWHFMPNRSVHENDAALASISQILELDPTVQEVLILPCSYMAEKSEQGKWLIRKIS